MSIVIVAASCASGLALIFILAAVVCAVRCNRRRGSDRFGRHHFDSAGNALKQLPVDVLLDYPNTTTLLKSDRDMYDQCPSNLMMNDTATDRTLPTMSVSETVENSNVGRNGSGKFSVDIAAAAAARPDVVRQPAHSNVAQAGGATLVRVSPEVNCDVKMAAEGRESNGDRPLNGLCGTKLKTSRRRLSLLSNHPATEVS